MKTNQQCMNVRLQVFLGILLSVFSGFCSADRIKDIAAVEGVRVNQLVGYGLVVGLDGTGDQTSSAPFTSQSFEAMLKQFGISLPEGSKLSVNNVAAVALHAELPAFAKPGQTIDVTVSSIANSKSLRGGSLLLSPLKGIDGQVYAIAQGSLIVGGFGANGQDGSSVTVNVPSVGRIPDGAIVERVVASKFGGDNHIVFNLHRADFTTAKRLSESINGLLGPNIAKPIDAASIIVQAPKDPSQRVDYISMLENLDVKPGEAAAKIIINSRTGTIVVGQHVRVYPVAITHGSLTVTIREDVDVTQPNPFGEGNTVVVPDTEIDIVEENSPMFKFNPGPTLNDIVRAVNDVGAAPGDVMAILEALKQAGALTAEIMVI